MNITLVDGSNILLRSYYAAATAIESHTLGTYINFVAKYARLTQPSKLMICWDSGKSTFRLNLWPQYKGQRIYSDEPSILFDHAKELTEILGLEQIEIPGIEADDIISEYSRMYSKNHVFIISADKDFSQLLSENVTIYHPGDNVPLTLERWNVEHEYTPEQYILIMALMGDKVDNIPGVGGVGIKTAAKLLRQVDWSIGTLLKEKPEFHETFLRNIALVDLTSDYIEVKPPPINWFSPVEGPDDERWPDVVKYLDENRLRMLKHSLLQGEFWE